MGNKKKFKAKWLVIVAAVAIIGAVIASQLTGGVEAEVASVTKGQIRQEIEETAEVLAKDEQRIYIEGSGKVVDVTVDVGDKVKKGQLLLSLDQTDLEFQLKNAEAQIAGAKAQLQGTELVNYANKIELAEAALNQEQLIYDSAQRDYEKAKQLFEAQALSKGEVEKAEDAYKIALAALEAAKLQLQDLKAGTPDYIKSGYESQLKQAVIQRDIISQNMQKQELRAKAQGVILEKLVEKNAAVNPFTPAFIMGSVENLEVEADVLADDIHRIQLGNTVEITGKAINGEILQGKVVKIAPAAKTVASSLGINQKRVPVTIALTEVSELLRPGYNVDIKIITAVKDDVLLVPDSAVFDYQGKSQVFVIENERAVLREVTKGIESNDFIEIVEGLKAGETILVKPDNSITEGSRIKPLAF